MKTKIYDARASQDITIDELPKQDNPNNSDLVIVQGASLTEATSIQQLRNKILSGSESISANLGEYVFSSALIENNSLHLMDGSIGYKDQYQEFYAWLLLQADSVKQFYLLDTVAESFIFPLINNRNLKINTAITNYTGGIAQAMTNHTHKVEGEYNNSFWLTQQQTPPNLTTQRRVLVQVNNSYLASTTTARDSAGINALSTGEQAYISSYMYVRVSSASNILSSKSILANGTISMDLDYTPTDPLDVATKRYIDNKFLNYPIPLSFSINDIGKRIPYYKNADTNPVLIALDGTKYLIADYPDFDYENQEGFTNDGVYFWFKNIELEIKNFQNDIQPSSEWFKIPSYESRPKGETLQGNFEFNSKMIYNFLQSPQGEPYLFANATDNAGFTILDPTTYKIRANYNNWGWITDGDVAPGKPIYKYKINGNSFFNDSITNTYRFAVTLENQGELKYFGAVGEVSYLKIKPDYMVAKIQQVGSVAGTGDLKSDRSVLLTGTGTFNTKQIVAMNDLTSQNIIVGGNARALITLDTKLNEVDTNIATITNNIGSVNITNLQNQVTTNTTDIDSIKTVNTNQDSTIASLQSQINSLQTKLNSYDTKYRNFTERRLKSGLSVSVSSNATNLTNLTQYFINSQSPTINSFGSSISGLPLGSIGLIEVGSGVSQGFKFPNINGIVNCNLTFSTRITGTISGTAGTPRELIVYIRRVSDNSIVANGGLIKINDNNFNARNVITPSFIQGANDPFLSGGFYLNMLNNSGGTLTINTIELLIQGY